MNDAYSDYDDNYYQEPGAHQRAHRGGMILAFGILGFAFCAIFGIVAWIMGNGDLREMDAGRMDPSGRDLTNAGRICGMIASILLLAGLGFFCVMMVIAAVGGGF